MKKKAKSIFLIFQFREFGIPYYVILGLDPRISVLGNFKFICNEIPRSSRGMTQGLGNSRIPYLHTFGSTNKAIKSKAILHTQPTAILPKIPVNKKLIAAAIAIVTA